uniref:Uncharacterized protein n=1 Tax=Tetranychus urticae TaxID=32264 RepID=T1JZ54_TETUR
MELASTSSVDLLEKIDAIENFNKKLINEMKQLDVAVTSISEAMTDTKTHKTLRYACVNDMIQIEQCLKAIESWSLSFSKYNCKVILIHHSTSGSYALDGESSLSVSIAESSITEEAYKMDVSGPTVLIKRALIGSVRNTAYVYFIDYGSNYQLEKENLFEYSEDIIETEPTVMLL